MQKKPIVLIICGALAVLAIVLLVVYLVSGGSTDIKNNKSDEGTDEAGIPQLTLEAYPEEETENNVEISVIATVGDGNEIVSVTTPDGRTTGYSSDKTYNVSKNGEYTFTVTASNGKTVTKTIKIENIIAISADNPYIPDGFKHIDETEVDTGFVIEDESGNQYVWVPVENGIAVREPLSDNYIEDDNTASAFTNSVAKYYGFYIARYEASKDTVNGMTVAKSVSDVIPWSNVNYKTAYSSAKNTAIAYNYTGVKTALINSYAWDTTLNWLNESVTNYSTARTYGNYSNQILKTGETDTDIINEISDMAGNLREWTTEKHEIAKSDDDNQDTEKKVTNSVDDEKEDTEERVIRGGSATIDKAANSHREYSIDLTEDFWGFRIILYKD